MDQEILREVVKQIPALVVLSFIVMIFMKYLNSRSIQAERRDEKLISFITEQNKQFERLGEGCHIIQERAAKVIHENTLVMGRMEKVLEESIRKIHVIGIEQRTSGKSEVS